MHVNEVLTHAKREAIEERFWSKVNEAGADDCWLWSGVPGKRGYGVLNVWQDGKAHLLTAHRLSYVLHYGRIEDGLFVCHRCDVRRCVNPSHLFLGTDADNKRDMLEKGRNYIPVGELSRTAKLTEKQARHILYDERETATIAAEFGVSTITIRQIKTGVTWKHIDGPRERRRTFYDPAFKAKIMADGRPSTVLGREYGIPHGTIRMWRKKRLMAG